MSDFSIFLKQREKNPKDAEMETKGLRFMTNFNAENEKIFGEAAQLHNLYYVFEDETYSQNGNRIDKSRGLKAFYIDESITNLTDYWRTVERLEKEAQSSPEGGVIKDE